MSECDRCGRAADDGATIQQTAHSRLCVVCVDWVRRQGTTTRDLDQQALDAFHDDD